MKVQEILSRLHGVKVSGEGQWKALCPGHPDKNPSLGVRVGGDGTILVRCYAKCETAAVLDKLGLSMRDLFPADKLRPSETTRRIVKTYEYTDADGRLLYEAVRYMPKDFRQRRPDGKGTWIWNLQGVARVLYHLPALLAADKDALILIVEGEKDADNLCALGLLATCNACGAGQWSKLSDDSAVHHHPLCIVPDRDGVGFAHAQQVAERLHGKAAEIRILTLPTGKDVSDYIEAAEQDGHAPEEIRASLMRLVETAPVYAPGMVIGPPAADAVAELRQEIEDEASGKRRPIPLAFCPRLDRLSRATVPGAVSSIAGSPGSAKSFAALNMILSADAAGFGAVYLPLELDRAFHLRRMAAILDGSWAVLDDVDGNATKAEQARAVMERHGERLIRLGKCILENPCKPTRENGRLIVPRVEWGDVLNIIEGQLDKKLIIVDPFTMVSFPGREPWQAQDEFVRRLVGMAAESGAVIVIVAHLVKKPDGKALTTGDVQGAASLGRLASTVWLLERYERRSLDVWAVGSLRQSVEANLTIHVAKSRHGEGTGLRLAYLFGQHGPRFEEHGIIAPRGGAGADTAEHYANA